MGQAEQMNPPPVKAISDQFAKSKSTVEKALMGLGRELQLVQRHKAESDVAVAAASILAREAFIGRLALLGKKLAIELPRGASKEVETVAGLVFAKHGEVELAAVAKMHFRTSYRVRGLPEPVAKEWKRQNRGAPREESDFPNETR
jgi:ribonuclease HIII